jgi:GNAT superfamily N-acetyltransferase
VNARPHGRGEIVPGLQKYHWKAMDLLHCSNTFRIMLEPTQELIARRRRRELGAAAGTIRKLIPAEREALAEHLLRLDPLSRNNRFGGGVGDAFIAAYARRAFARGSMVHGWFVDGTLRAVAELHPFDPRGRRAEAAFSVEPDFQDYGIGSVLMGRTLLAASNRGIRTLIVRCVADNVRMQAIAKKYGAELKFEPGDVVGELQNPWPTPLSLWRELVQDTHGFASAALDLQARILRSA